MGVFHGNDSVCVWVCFMVMRVSCVGVFHGNECHVLVCFMVMIVLCVGVFHGNESVACGCVSW